MAKHILRSFLKDNITTVKASIIHPMETGIRKNKKTKEIIPAHFIQEVQCEHNSTAVMIAQWGPAISKNPYLSFKFQGGRVGDNITLNWIDNQGKLDSITTKIKNVI